MTAKVPSQAIVQQLFAVPETRVYAVLDGASSPGLPQNLAQFKVESECLFRGEMAADMMLVAPYLASLRPDHPFTDWLLQEGWGRHWGVFVICKAEMRELRMHLRTFLKVYGPDLKPLFFRYYDPRVLRAYLPTCNAQESRLVFGPVLRYVCEAEDPTALLKFWTDSGQVKSEAVRLA